SVEGRLVADRSVPTSGHLSRVTAFESWRGMALVRTKRTRALALAGLAMALGSTTVVAPEPASAATIFVEYTKPAPGPLGPIAVLGDSVMLGNVLEVEGY